MQFGCWPASTNPFADTLQTARHAEATGWDSVWYADHYLPGTNDATGGMGPMNTCLPTVAALAATVPRVRIGTMVCGIPFHTPGVLAKQAATVDNISGGRFVLGLGAAWSQAEADTYGVPFPPLGERFARLDEACQVLTGMFANERTTFKGKFFRVENAPLSPRPVQEPLPLLIGGSGEQKTLRLAARYASVWNTWGTPEVIRQKMAVLDDRCREIGRDPKTLKRCANVMLVLTDNADIIARNVATGRPLIAGDVSTVKARVREYAEMGLDELIIPDWNMGSWERRRRTMDTFITEVAPAFR